MPAENSEARKRHGAASEVRPEDAPGWLVFGVLDDFRAASEVQVRGILATAENVKRRWARQWPEGS